MKRSMPFLGFLIGLFSCQANPPLETVSQVDIEKYQGKWYEIARLPNRFEKGLECVSATYTLRSDGKINVLNQGIEVGQSGKLKKINGTAWVPDSRYPGRLKVSFFWPFAGRYWIILLDKEYRYALVGDPSRRFLWILSRSKVMELDVIQDLKNKAVECGFDVSKLEFVRQQCP